MRTGSRSLMSITVNGPNWKLTSVFLLCLKPVKHHTGMERILFSPSFYVLHPPSKFCVSKVFTDPMDQTPTAHVAMSIPMPVSFKILLLPFWIVDVCKEFYISPIWSSHNKFSGSGKDLS